VGIESASTDETAPQDTKEYLMKLAITAAGPDLSSPVDQRFGRARYLLIVDTPERNPMAIDNLAGMNAAQGAGIQAAQSVIDNRAAVLITGHCGPKAFRALRAAGIDVLLTSEGTVAGAVDRFEAGELALAPAADVDGHW
jgi:predicted Fe-Mo cluster-binding NifX family protein